MDETEVKSLTNKGGFPFGCKGNSEKTAHFNLANGFRHKPIVGRRGGKKRGGCGFEWRRKKGGKGKASLNLWTRKH